ncbi:MAG: universal stress protein [Halolamina sp.]|uniref:universal stress protein n=1 Tax=Halolamina sp. TaxID=1940283 RepID=UPI002FC32560
MYHHILVPCDGSSESKAAGRHALDLAQRGEAAVQLLYVTGVGSGTTTAGEPTGEYPEQVAPAFEYLEQRAGERGVSVETDVRGGQPAATIVETAAEEAVDLVVMGTRGRTGLPRVVFGSVAEEVVRSASVPVMTVSQPTEKDWVTSPQQAQVHAEHALESAGHESADVGSPSRQRTTWVVAAEDDQGEYNVHINSASGEARIVKIR